MSVNQLQDAIYGAQRLNILGTKKNGKADPQRFYALVRDGVLPDGVIVRCGKTIRVNPERLEEWIASGGRALPGGWKREAA